MKKIVVIQARMSSTRFPGKVLKTLQNKPILQWVINAALRIPTIDQVIVATSDTEADVGIVDWCLNHKIAVSRGSEINVLKRFYDTAIQYNGGIIVRITADCPLLDPYIAGQVLYLVSSGAADYASNVMPPTWPDGLDCEAFTMQALESAFQNAKRDSELEHVTPYIRNNQHKFRVRNIASPIMGLGNYRWTIDTREDLDFIELLIKHSKENATTYDFLETLERKKDIIQPQYKRNEGFEKSLRNEQVLCKNFQNSQVLLQRSLKTIPLGSQTFSKSHIQYPENTSPFFLTHGQGSRVWDIDGNEYIDLVSALLPNILGYNDSDVNYAIQNQLQKGIVFSLATELEVLLAEKLCEMIPSAEKVRFAKTGTDVTSAAVRLARAYTDRDKIIVCGYHGWQDWSIGTTTRNKGIPKDVSKLSCTIPYNDLEVLEQYLKTEEFAGIIMEPCNATEPKIGYLNTVKELCEKYGSLLIFDEVITGFRFALGGAQEYFKVMPHLSCFGKAMGNGMPISAIVGQNNVMKEMEQIFFSGTFGGEALSLAAAISTLDKIARDQVIPYLWSYGQELSSAIEVLIDKYGLSKIIKLVGYAPWKIFQFFEYADASLFDIKTLFIQEMIARGILINSSLNINFSHNELDKQKVLLAIDEVFSILAQGLNANRISSLLRSPTVKPIFKVR